MLTVIALNSISFHWIQTSSEYGLIEKLIDSYLSHRIIDSFLRIVKYKIIRLTRGPTNLVLIL